MAPTSIKTQCFVFRFYQTLQEIASAIESDIRWAKQFLHVNPIKKQCHIALILIIVNELLILVIQVATSSFIVAIFVTQKKVLIKWCYTSKDVSYFWNVSKFFRTSRKNVTKIHKKARQIKLPTWHLTSRTPVCGCSQNKSLLLIKFKSCPFVVWFVLMFKNIKIFYRILQLDVHLNSSMQ